MLILECRASPLEDANCGRETYLWVGAARRGFFGAAAYPREREEREHHNYLRHIIESHLFAAFTMATYMAVATDLTPAEGMEAQYSRGIQSQDASLVSTK